MTTATSASPTASSAWTTANSPPHPPTMPAPPPDPWFPLARPNPAARLRLVCLPFAGGGASVFRQWPDGLPLDVDVLAAQPPGRESRFREPACTHMDRLVAALADAAGPRLDRPY